MSAAHVLRSYPGGRIDDYDQVVSELCDEYETAWYVAYEREVVRAARFQIGDGS